MRAFRIVSPLALWPAISLLLPACTPESSDPALGLADLVLDAPSASAGPYGDPERAINGVRGSGCCAGGTDVFALGQDDGVDDWVELGWSGVVVDGDGPDLVVFENAFEHDGGVFVEPAIVQVRAAEGDWATFPYDYVAHDETVHSADPDDWQGFAGLRPVFLHAEDYPVDPSDTSLAGGDPFDLADLPPGEARDAIESDGACCVRIVSARGLTNPDTGAPFPPEASAGAADIDGVWGRLRP